MASSNGELSMNARKLQEEEIERLVKCRVRSEIEARKAAEATMKRAVQESRELKKELMVMRQEKEERKQDSKKATMAAATTPAPGGVATKDDLQKKLNHEKNKRKQVASQLEESQQEAVKLRDQLEQRDAQLAKVQSVHDDELCKAHDELKARQRDFDLLQDETKKLKSAADDAKRKCQRAVKDKKEELQKLMDENAQLAKRCEPLERLAEENAKLRKLLDKAKDRQGGVADEWQRRLDQREQAFLRQEQDNKQRLAETQREIDALMEERDDLAERLQQLEAEASSRERFHAAALAQEAAKFQALVHSTEQLQQRLLTLKDAGRVADRARLDAEARLAKAETLRETAEAAADAVESRAEKTESQLRDAKQQLEDVERALKKKGITIEYLIKTTATSGSGTSKRTSMKEPKGPEESDADEPTAGPAAVPKKKLPATGAAPPVATIKTTAKIKPNAVSTVQAKPLVAKAKQVLSTSTNNQSHIEREPTPERVRK